MAHGINPMIKREIEDNHMMNHNNNIKSRIEMDTNCTSTVTAVGGHPATATKMGSRRIFTPQFKLQVLDSYRNDTDCKGNQRATARKYGIHRRQIQKWLQCETNLRSTVNNNNNNSNGGASNKINQIQHHPINNNFINVMATTPKSNNTINGHPTQLQNVENINLALDKTRHSVALVATTSAAQPAPTTTSTKNKSNTGFLSPVHTHSMDYTPVTYEQHNNVLPSASLPNSPLFTATLNSASMHQQQQQQQHLYEIRDCCAAAAAATNCSNYHSVQLSNGINNNFLEYLPTQNQYCENISLLPPPPPAPTTITNYYENYYEILETQSAITTPIDLSLHSRRVAEQEINLQKRLTPSPPSYNSWPLQSNYLPPPSANCYWDYEPEAASKQLTELTTVDCGNKKSTKAWDLSCRKRKATDSIDYLSEDEGTSTKSQNCHSKAPKKVKLFKPYLLSDDEEEEDECKAAGTTISSKNYYKSEQKDAIIWSNYSENYSAFSCSPPTSSTSSTAATTDCYSATPQYTGCYNYGSPVSGYDSASSSYSSSSECGDNSTQMHSPSSKYFSNDFKIQVIDSYYNDMRCRGDENAIADKYQVHRRQIQNWLQHEDFIRQEQNITIQH